MLDKPVIRCLVAYPYREGDFVVWSETVSLELAAMLSALGWAVLVDPRDQCDLAAWERLQFSLSGGWPFRDAL